MPTHTNTEHTRDERAKELLPYAVYVDTRAGRIGCQAPSEEMAERLASVLANEFGSHAIIVYPAIARTIEVELL